MRPQTCTARTQGAYEQVMCDRPPHTDDLHIWTTDGWSPSIAWRAAA